MSISPPRPKSPPLNALRAFEAAARLGGFAKAAEELSVSPGAISQHIKSLESWVGVALFERQSQGVVLSQTGVRLAPGFIKAFDALGAAVRDLCDEAPERAIQIAALPSVAQLWLPSRMSILRSEFPGTKLSVTALEDPPNLKRDIFDMTFFLGAPTGIREETVLEEDEIFPVCAPNIAARLKAPSDLQAETLILDASWRADWSMWCEAAGLDLRNLEEAAQYSLYALALEEARNGAGVLIGHKSLVRPALRDGSLVAPFQHRVSTGLCLIMTATKRAHALAQRIKGLVT
ncbi:LysR substrate-binding domain-containing protein [Roseovarius rhodophyticola]|uniref:LysR substrate-binding domain-containing protein n=1 Tax=Roseovarius rhodophyticola TaxID=3080827 RepID=A0ABZ2TIU4_9RHOB|nr:LysR substrate-binding domain-containing protein [Roseovarius sp. W115]